VKICYVCCTSMLSCLVPSRFRHGKELRNEIVLITGSGSGIGRLLAVRLARLGCRLVLWDLDEKSNEGTATLCRVHTDQVYAYCLDVGEQLEVERCAERVRMDVRGEVNVLINNAGLVHGRPLLETSPDLIRKTMRVNCEAHFWTIQAFLPAMLQNDHGHIVEVASAAGHCGANGLVDYCASKFAVVGLAESLLLDVCAAGKENVHVTLISPFFMNTGMFEGVSTRWPRLIPMLNSDDCADQIIDAIRHGSGMLMMPRFLYFVGFLKALLPVKAQVMLCEFFGITVSMEHFKGRVSSAY